jgi:ferredoxin
MAYVITEPCVGCKDGACTQVCPCDCIHPLPKEAGAAEAKQLFINPSDCIDCGLCALECPVNAIFAQDEVPPQWQHYVQINADHYPH